MRDVVIFALALALAALLTVVGCGPSTTTVEASFSIDGMTCESCSSAITDTLSKVEGVESASADHIIGSARAVFRSPDVTVDQLVGEIEGLGYTVTATRTVAIGD
jgi:copper chaperone CopZ